MPADPAQRARAIEARRWALPYIRDWIEGDPAGRVHRQEIEHLRAAIRIAGGDDYRGYALLGLAEAILRLAGAQRWDMRGYLVSHLGLPASETEIAAALGVDPQCAAWAIRALSGPRVGLLERVAWPPARPAPGEGPPADGPDGPQADRTTRPPDAGEAAPAQVGDRAKLLSPDALACSGPGPVHPNGRCARRGRWIRTARPARPTRDDRQRPVAARERGRSRETSRARGTERVRRGGMWQRERTGRSRLLWPAGPRTRARGTARAAGPGRCRPGRCPGPQPAPTRGGPGGGQLTSPAYARATGFLPGEAAGRPASPSALG